MLMKLRFFLIKYWIKKFESIVGVINDRSASTKVQCACACRKKITYEHLCRKRIHLFILNELYITSFLIAQNAKKGESRLFLLFASAASSLVEKDTNDRKTGIHTKVPSG